MSASLSSTRAAARKVDADLPYRAIPPLAVVSALLGVLSVVAIFEIQLGILPLASIVAGWVAWRRIRQQPEELTGGRLALAAVVLGVLCLAGGGGHAAYVYYTEVPEGYRRLSYEVLQPAEGMPPDRVPPSARAWDGQRVYIQGYVYPGDKSTGIKEFVLCRDNGDCCFGGSPKLTDMILVRLQGNLTLEFSPRAWKVGGVLHVVETEAVDNLGTVLYQLDADILR